MKRRQRPSVRRKKNARTRRIRKSKNAKRRS
jgi:hypothetical protein